MDNLIDALRIENNLESKAHEGRMRLRVACNALRGELFNILEALDGHQPLPGDRLQSHAEAIDVFSCSVILAEEMLEKIKPVNPKPKLHLVGTTTGRMES